MGSVRRRMPKSRGPAEAAKATAESGKPTDRGELNVTGPDGKVKAVLAQQLPGGQWVTDEERRVPIDPKTIVGKTTPSLANQPQYSEDAVKMLAEQAMSGDPAALRSMWGGAGLKVQVMNALADAAKARWGDQAGVNMAAINAMFAGDKGALTGLSKLRANVENFEGTALREANLALELAPKGLAGQSPAVNRWVQAGRQWLGRRRRDCAEHGCDEPRQPICARHVEPGAPVARPQTMRAPRLRPAEQRDERRSVRRRHRDDEAVDGKPGQCHQRADRHDGARYPKRRRRLGAARQSSREPGERANSAGDGSTERGERAAGLDAQGGLCAGVQERPGLDIAQRCAGEAEVMDWETAGDPTPLNNTPSPDATSPARSAPGPVPRQQIVEFWKAKGAPPQVAEGIADAVRRESGIRGTAAYDPTAVNPQSGATGLYQDLGSRKAALVATADWEDPATQNNFAYKEVTGGDPEATKHWDEIKAAPSREAASELWTKYFERSRPASSTATVSAGNWNVSPAALDAETRQGHDVRYMSPGEYLAMTPPIEEGSSQSAKFRRLMASLNSGDDVESVPTLDVKRRGDQFAIYDQDGRNRALAAQQAGVDLIPVSIRGLPKSDTPPQAVRDMRGEMHPFDFERVLSAFNPIGTAHAEQAQKSPAVAASAWEPSGAAQPLSGGEWASAGSASLNGPIGEARKPARSNPTGSERACAPISAPRHSSPRVCCRRASSTRSTRSTTVWHPWEPPWRLCHRAASTRWSGSVSPAWKHSAAHPRPSGKWRARPLLCWRPER